MKMKGNIEILVHKVLKSIKSKDLSFRNLFLIHLYSILLQHLRDIFFERCYKDIIYSEYIQCKSPRVEPLSRESIFGPNLFICFLISIDFVPDNRVSDGGHMHADLVGSSREELDFEERVFVVDVTQEREFRPCELGVDGIFGGHPFAIVRVSSDEGFDHAFFVFHESEDDSIVEFLYLPIRHFFLEFFHGSVVFRDEDEPARILVEPVDDPRSLHTVDDREIPEVVEEGIHECSRISELAGNRMGIDPRILTDDREIGIVENNFQVHILSNEMGFLGFEFYFENISFFHPFIVFENPSVYLQVSFFYEFLHIRARMLRKKGR